MENYLKHNNYFRNVAGVFSKLHFCEPGKKDQRNVRKGKNNYMN